MKKIFILSFSLFLAHAFLAQEQNTENNQEANDNFEEGMMQIMEQMFSSKAELEDAYNFNGMVSMQNISNGTDTAVLNLWLGEKGHFGMDGLPGQTDKKAFVVYDKNQEAMFMFAEEQGQKFAMSMGMPGTMPGREVKQKELDLVKGSGQKEILGYNCQEYIIENQYKKTVYWITDENSKELMAINDLVTKMEIFKDAEHMAEYGIVLGTDVENNLFETKESNEITSLDQSAKFVFYASNYELMSMKELMEMEKAKMEVPQD